MMTAGGQFSLSAGGGLGLLEVRLVPSSVTWPAEGGQGTVLSVHGASLVDGSLRGNEHESCLGEDFFVCFYSLVCVCVCVCIEHIK